MPAWVSSAVRPAPTVGRIMVRFGGSIFDAAFSRYKGWLRLVPGGGEESIAPPPLWWDRDAPDLSIEEERRLVFGQETTSAKPVRGHQQLGFNLEVSDSGMLSQGQGKAPNSTGRLV